MWKRPDATFEKPIIPTPADREFIHRADEKIIKALREWENQSRAIGMELDMNAREEANLGVFLNANRYNHVADFYTAWHRATARTIVHFARILKKRNEDLLVGAFYGSYGCTGYFDGGTCSGTLTIMDSGVVDFLDTVEGDPSKTKKAKDTILYAVIGLIICALAFAIVNFVISNIINNSANANSNNSSEVIKGGGPTK